MELLAGGVRAGAGGGQQRDKEVTHRGMRRGEDLHVGMSGPLWAKEGIFGRGGQEGQWEIDYIHRD